MLLGCFRVHKKPSRSLVRSLHPLHSFCSIGRNASKFCCNNSLNNFGYGSPLSRLHLEGGHILSIGLPAGYCLAIAHYVETMFAVPYVYNKLLECEVIKGAEPISADFTATVRYLELEYSLEFSAWIKELNKTGSIKGVELGRHSIFCCSIQKCLRLRRG